MANVLRARGVERIRRDGTAFLAGISLTGDEDEPVLGASDSEYDHEDAETALVRRQQPQRPKSGHASTRHSFMGMAATDLLASDGTDLTSQHQQSQRRRRRLTSGDMERLRDAFATSSTSQARSSTRPSKAMPKVTFVSDVKTNAELLVNTRVLVTSPRGGMPLAAFSLLPARDTRHKKRRRLEKAKQADKFEIKPVRKTKSYEKQLRDMPQVHDHATLDDPFLHHGRHQKMLSLKSYTVSISHYVTPAELKEALNESFRERFPDIQLTLSKLRSLKRDMVEIGCDMCKMEVSTVAFAHYYFEHLVLKRWVTKPTRKLIPACCLLLAFKFNCTARPSIVKQRLQPLFKACEDKWRLARHDILLMEMPVFSQLSFDLNVPAATVTAFTARIHAKHPHLCT
ncbi:hypothetical protein PTSG_05276 [Salpingoeca rosetta]|uniref:Cyclin N-terminal domain-containing protein n=1 Tax=Salpingoeca rosetta (strain ATCC 50818 / BSB-021) TaxID=946362 RepID=F2U9Z4_SALR5|nr:uncharacterized protein PTSG_05276 [Salpingoeca rosetta]EGD73569.1 hypothetical protein PTSG_05276 [Salpingoeca rosetta]|eukprot:XP_004993851.1 hypothetical protein PTSG_05276 [Salpingoeca rosetta]